MGGGVSAVGPTVEGMSAHVCTYFDDGDGVDLLCVCGSRAVLVLTDEGETLAVLEDEAPALSRTA